MATRADIKMRVRPRVRALAALALTAALLVLAGNLDSTALGAMSAGLTIAIPLDLAGLALRLLLERKGAGASRTTAQWARAADALLPRPATDRCTWERIDQAGRAVGALELEGEPAGRGLWRSAGRTRGYLGWFSMWRAELTETGGHEAVHPPQESPSAYAAPIRQALSRAGLCRAPDIGTVRPYRPGDPWRMVSWRQTAHHGEVMVRETAPEGASRMVIVPDLSAGMSDDAIAQGVASLAAACSARGVEPVVLDGQAAATGRDAAGRYAAAFCRDACDLSTPSQAQGVAGQVAALPKRAGTVVLAVLGQGDESPLSRLLRDARIAPEVPSVPVTEPEGEDAAAEGSSPAPGKASAPPGLWGDLEAAVIMAACLLATVSVLSSLVEPARWAPFAYASLTAVSLDAALGQHIRRRAPKTVRPLLACAVEALIALAALTLISLIYRDETGSWLFATGVGDSPVNPLASLVGEGITSLYLGQWVPVSVSPTGDCALIALFAAVSVLLRVALAPPALRPFAPFLLLAALAVRLTFLGSGEPAALIVLACASWLGLLALDRPQPHPLALDRPSRERPPSKPAPAMLAAPLVPATFAAFLALAASPQVTTLADRIPIDLGLDPDLLSTNTVSPVVDLRRNLSLNTESVAFTYRSTGNEPSYFKLTTLSDFDGDAWLLDGDLPSSTAAGSLWNAPAAQRGEGGSEGAPAFGGQGPYAEEGNLLPLLISGQDPNSVDLTGQVRMTEVTIANLSSRFLPLAVGTFHLDSHDGVPGDWKWAADGSVYGTESLTERGDAYWALSQTDRDPITSSDDARSLEQAARENRQRIDANMYGSPGIDTSALTDLPEALPQHILDAARQIQDGLGGQDGGAVGKTTGVQETLRRLAVMSWIMAYLEQPGFTYSLDAPDGLGTDNLEVIDDFLNNRSGYCAHYASAAAVLARALDVPARLAMGYTARGRKAEDGSHQVTNRDLHVWVEAYVPGVGWVGYDPTPASGEDTAPVSDAGAPVEDAETGDGDGPPAGTTALTSPVDDDGTDEDGKDPSKDSATGTAPVAEALSAITEAVSRNAAAVGIALAAIAALASPFAWRCARRAHRLRAVRRGSPDAAAAAWSELLATARHAGVSLPQSATEEDIARAVCDALAKPGSPAEASGQAAFCRDAIASVRRIARAACAAAYGSAHIEPPRTLESDLAQALAALDALRRRPRPRRSRRREHPTA